MERGGALMACYTGSEAAERGGRKETRRKCVCEREDLQLHLRERQLTPSTDASWTISALTRCPPCGVLSVPLVAHHAT